MKNSRYFTGALVVFSFLSMACSGSASMHNETISAADKINAPAMTPTPEQSVPKGWVLFPSPVNSAERQCANASEDERKVENENGRVKFSKYIYAPDEQMSKLPIGLKKNILKNRNIGEGLGGYLHAEPFNGGWLIGSDAGEWGGKLFWFSEDGNQKDELLEDNIRGIAKIGDETFVLSGLAHLSIDEGKIYKLTKDEKGKPGANLLIDLKTQPETFTVENNNALLIVLNDKIVRFKKSGELETLRQVNLSSLYPNSMIVDSAGIIYIGMRLFVVRLVPAKNGYAEEWLVREDCRKFAEKNYDCVCLNGK